MRIIIRRESDYQHNQYCLLEFTGRFEGDEGQSRSMVNIGNLEKLNAKQKGKTMYRLQMGTIDIIGYADEKFDEHFLYTQSIKISDEEKVILVKGVVKKRIIFNKRPSPNLDRIGDEKPKQQGYSMFKGKKN